MRTLDEPDAKTTGAARRVAAPARDPGRTLRSTAVGPPFALAITFVLLVLYTGRLAPVVADLLLVVLVLQALRLNMAVPRHPAAVASALAVAIAGVQVATDLAGGAREFSMMITNLGAIYGAAFAFAVYALLRRWEAVVGRVHVWERIWTATERSIPFIVIVTACLAARLVAMPTFGAGFPAFVRPIFYVGTAAVAPTLAFTLPVLTSARRGSVAHRWRRPLLAGWCASVIVFAFEGRAVALGVGLGLGVTYLRPARIARVIYLAVVLLVVLWASGLTMRAGTREISFDVAVEAAASVVTSSGSDSQTNLYATKEWRTDWWEQIVEDIRDGPFLISGHGWEMSLGDRYGINDARISRDAGVPLAVFPHNLFLTLAGLGGLVLAVTFFVIPVSTLLRGRRFVGEVGVPLVTGARAALVAALVVSMTGVLIEGSGGGSFFWILIGLLWWADAPACPIAPDLSMSDGRM